MRPAAALLPLSIRPGALASTLLLAASLLVVAPAPADAGNRARVPRTQRFDDLSYDRVHHRLKLRAPTANGDLRPRYRKRSVLRYRKELGDTGMVFRAKAGLKRRNALKLELLF